jgi:hypothetical protein
MRTNSTPSHTVSAVIMKRFLPALLSLSVLLTGCARSYVITMNNGTRVTTQGKPKLQGGNYVFKDATGQRVQVPAGRVREVAPASMAKEEGSQFMR